MVAEKGRNRAFVDLLLERQSSNEMKSKSKGSKSDSFVINTLDHIKDIVNRQRAAVLYYSVAAGFLYSWLILPSKGKQSIIVLLMEKYKTNTIFRSGEVPFGFFDGSGELGRF